MVIDVIDNFLPLNDFYEIRNHIMKPTFPVYIQTGVSSPTEEDFLWNWYGIHTIYFDNIPKSNFYELINDKIISKINNFKSLIRCRVNVYPWTETLQEHGVHVDKEWQHNSCILSLNTCDGYTKVYDNENNIFRKIESVENRMLFFDGSVPHHSTTTTTSKLRYNIALNYL